ncbi:MAG: 5'-methylthioadenosine/S-adenosylhomocysteine nucleosidase [Lachnospiraceae bacterium]|nr:5'-methylthioadenosine/S-adenosylhomocysteine nucleosidase [Lachnospiraceae bacterium]
MQSKKTFDKKPIILMGALNSECGLITDALTDRESFIYGDCKFTEGYLDGYPVVTVMSLMGQVNAAFATTLVIGIYNPKCIIFNGTAGAHDPQLHQGDIILGENIVTTRGYFTPQKAEGEGLGGPDEFEYFGCEMIIEGEDKSVKYFQSDENLLKIAEKIPCHTGKLRRGTVLSGDFWNREIDRLKFYRSSFGSDCEEMEGFPIAQICAKLDCPFLLIRIISNSEYYPEELFDEIFGVKCQEYTIEVMREMIRETV